MKKWLSLLLAGCMLAVCLTGCAKETPPENPGPQGESDTPAVSLKVGLCCGTSSIDDKSFIQSAWEGLQKAEADLGVEIGYLQSSDDSTTATLEAIADLVDAGYQMIVMPGFSFQQAAYDAQSLYPDVMFVTIDTAPWNSGDDSYTIADNTVAVDYDAEQGGFLAGFGSAIELKEGEFGGLFGVETDHTKLFITGFKQGVIYANENYDTNIRLNADNFVWSGTYSDAALGQQIAAQMYENGINLIYAAAGSTSLGAFNEAKSRAENGEKVWVVHHDHHNEAGGQFRLFCH